MLDLLHGGTEGHAGVGVRSLGGCAIAVLAHLISLPLVPFLPSIPSSEEERRL